ncbi:hypothetical protein KO527_05205 [Pseudoalteromonas sp. C2R02]|uniref:hypothetical protein n=1 Tax=Pseudoalteromonas sp. C2R02 TaxID=2841565 RepID=UPI001C083A4D|nr:hypothetical protein [Pseudoalteromonas sp. C2R02]MBU2968745.1 hypothetical protein [Pseudoalteromonas sp. C2R02]
MKSTAITKLTSIGSGAISGIALEALLMPLLLSNTLPIILLVAAILTFHLITTVKPCESVMFITTCSGVFAALAILNRFTYDSGLMASLTMAVTLTVVMVILDLTEKKLG